MKEQIKRFLSSAVFKLHEKRILKGNLCVRTIPETVEQLVDSQCSLVRFGDGEIKLISGKEIPFQKPDPQLTHRLKKILQTREEGLLVALPDVFRDVSAYRSESRVFWMEHMLFHRKDYIHYCLPDRIYENAFFSRPYIMYRDRSQCGTLFEQMKKIWNEKNVVFVEGEISHNGVDVDLFNGAKSIERIICPSAQAWQVYDRILQECLKLSKEKLVLVSLGAAGKVLTVDLHREGYRVIDIGSLDMEYGWFCEKEETKCRVPKHEIKTREENEAAGYYRYLAEIVAMISG